ncbi:MAG: endolytic transglycosylase MltG [Bryobacteraceae bacterium]
MILRGIALFTLAAILAAAGLVYFFVHLQPYAGFDEPVFIDIPRGTSTRELAAKLERNGVVRSDWQFLLVRILRPKALLQAGEYRFAHPASPWEVFDRIVRGDIFYYELAVPEGSNIFDIAAALERLGLMTADAFLEAARDPSLIRDLAPEAPSLEGYLFPSTYRIARHTTAIQICREMTAEFRRVWEKLGGNGDVHRKVTLASLVEKEARVPSERPLIASVYWNRLKQGMRMDADPSTIYAALLENRYRGTIYRSDLERDHPYNTYRKAGLPPGPIANPGADALRAVLEPAETAYLYFVRIPDSSGAHEFNETLAEHNRAVARYRRGIQGQNQAPRPAGVSQGNANRLPQRNGK